jgi:hypothetical protein
LQGGPEVHKAKLTLRPQYVTQEGGRYGDSVTRVRGVLGFDAEAEREHALTTRMHSWTVQRAGQAAADAVQAGWEIARGALRKLGFADMDQWSEFERSGAAAQPWTGVNNCTDDDEAAMLRADLLRGSGGSTVKVIPHESDETGRFGPCIEHRVQPDTASTG